MMKKWLVEWQFNHLLWPQHGTTGVKVVRASDESNAKEVTKREAAAELFRTTEMQGHIDVITIKEVEP